MKEFGAQATGPRLSLRLTGRPRPGGGWLGGTVEPDGGSGDRPGGFLRGGPPATGASTPPALHTRLVTWNVRRTVLHAR